MKGNKKLREKVHKHRQTDEKTDRKKHNSEKVKKTDEVCVWVGEWGVHYGHISKYL